MVPSRRLAGVAGLSSSGLVAVLLQVPFTVDPFLTGSTALFAGLTVTLSLWGLPRIGWSNEDELTPGVFEFGLIAAVSVLPTLAFLPVFFIDALALGTQIALTILVMSVGFTGYAGCVSMLAYNHARHGGDIEFTHRPG